MCKQPVHPQSLDSPPTQPFLGPSSALHAELEASSSWGQQRVQCPLYESFVTSRVCRSSKWILTTQKTTVASMGRLGLGCPYVFFRFRRCILEHFDPSLRMGEFLTFDSSDASLNLDL